MAEKTKRTYFTKADLLDFGKFIESDERRGLKQEQARKHQENGVIGFIPWTQLIRQVTEQDVKDWQELKKRRNELRNQKKEVQDLRK